MQTLEIAAQRRGRYTKGEIHKARRRGRVPGAVFGRDVEPFLVEVGARDIVQILGSESGLNTMIKLTIEGEKPFSVMIAELDRNPITHGFLHVGFQSLGAKEKVHTHVPVRLVGEPEAVRLHEGLLEQTLETLDVRALPGDLPAHIDVDVSKLKMGDKLHVSDLPHNAKIEILNSEETAVASLHLGRTVEAEAPSTITEATSPAEVVETHEPTLEDLEKTA